MLEQLALIGLEVVSVGDLLTRGRADRTVWFESGAGY
jgi:hypothetical protein